MFVYVNENDVTLNVSFANDTEEMPSNVSIQGFKNGAKVLVNDKVVIDLADAVPFDVIRRPFIYQKNNKLNVTFQDDIPVESPEVIIDSISDSEVSVTANGTTIKLKYDKSGASIIEEETETPDPDPEPTPKPDPEPVPDPDPEPVLEPDTELVEDDTPEQEVEITEEEVVEE